MAPFHIALFATYLHVWLVEPLRRHLSNATAAPLSHPLVLHYLPTKTSPISHCNLDQSAITTSPPRDAALVADDCWPLALALLLALFALGGLVIRHRSLAMERTGLLVALTAAHAKTAALRDALRGRGKLRCARRTSHRQFVFLGLSRQLTVASRKVAKLESELTRPLTIIDTEILPTDAKLLPADGQLPISERQPSGDQSLHSDPDSAELPKTRKSRPRGGKNRRPKRRAATEDGLAEDTKEADEGQHS